MRKALWFLIAILLCFASAAEALTCNNCRQFKIGTGCLTENPPVPCTANPGQKCQVVRYDLKGRPQGIITQRCTKTIRECVAKVSHKEVGNLKTTCCNRDNCNTP